MSQGGVHRILGAATGMGGALNRPMPVDILILRAHECSEDPRIEKILWHYRQNGLSIGLVCTPRGGSCHRRDAEGIIHRSFGFGEIDPRQSRTRRRLQLLREQLALGRSIRSTFRPRAIHGCDLDGYLSARVNFPWKRKTVFEVYDLWTTMTSNSSVAFAERRALASARGVILPAEEMRVPVAKSVRAVMRNVVDPSLALRAMESASALPGLPDRYLLAGGSRVGSQIDALASLLSQHQEIDLVIAEPEPPGWPNGTHVWWIGRQSWGTWLRVLAQSSAVWVWYDNEIEHYKSNLSPNKYWEACLFNVPMVVNSTAQFCDRSEVESRVVSVGDFRAAPRYAVEQIAKIVSDKSRPRWERESWDFWYRTEKERTESLQILLAGVGLTNRNDSASGSSP